MQRSRVQILILGVALSGGGSMLQATEFAGGTGTQADPYQIATAEQLLSIRSASGLWDKHFALACDRPDAAALRAGSAGVCRIGATSSRGASHTPSERFARVHAGSFKAQNSPLQARFGACAPMVPTVSRWMA